MGTFGCGGRPEPRTWLEKESAYLDPFVVQALLADEARPRMTQMTMEYCLFFVA